MDWISELPVWLLALTIFGMRVIDVSLGTIRTITVVGGMISLSVVLGFFESFLWLIAVQQAITRLNESPYLPVFYAGGFAMGNAVGIILERFLAFGYVIFRIISIDKGNEIAGKLREQYHQVLTTFEGMGKDGPRMMIFVSCERKRVSDMLKTALELDPELYYTVERANDWRQIRRPFFNATGWRDIAKKK